MDRNGILSGSLTVLDDRVLVLLLVLACKMLFLYPRRFRFCGIILVSCYYIFFFSMLVLHLFLRAFVARIRHSFSYLAR